MNSSTTPQSTTTANAKDELDATAAATTRAHPLSPRASSSSYSYIEITLEKRERLFIITFNRPALRNALTRRAYYELIRALNAATFNDAITTIVLTGAAGCFTAGNDLTQPQMHGDNATAYFSTSNFVLAYVTKAFIHCPKVLVALVDGACVGIGLVLVTLCDIVYCTERAYFQASFTQLGLCPEGCASYLLPQLMGRVKAAEVLLFGARLNAQQALAANLVARIVPLAALERELWSQLLEYSRLPVESLRATKRLLTKDECLRLQSALKAECLELEQLRMGETYQGALRAFVERRRGDGVVESQSKL